MTRIPRLVTAVAALAMTASNASATFLLGLDASGNMKVVNIETQEEHQVLEGIPGQPMSGCPAGTFFLSSDPTGQKPVITDCATGREYELGREGASPVGGYPRNTFFLFGPGSEEEVRMEEELWRPAR